ncbi:MAG: DUF4625 domain-containing protein [Phaeodactylibacter sp.]|nr:DUF4625 domain-containing protein [Phaeodactylibacter sp.]
MKIRIVLLALVLVAISQSCTDSDIDLTPPGMQLLAINPAPTAAIVCGSLEDSVFVLTGGETLDFEALFQDDQALSEFKIDIHNNFDCHGHGGASAPGISVPNVDSQTEDWTVLDIVPLEGKEDQINRSLQVPENVTAGTYHFQLQVLDAAGNDNPLANFYSLKITNPTDSNAPVIAATAPTGNFSVAKGESIQFSGTVTDDISLSQGGNGVLFLSYTDLSSGNTFTSDAAFPFDNSVQKTYDFDFSFTVPATLQAGSYRFSLRAQDGVRNVATPIEFEVEVTN